jgi:hypothetical protein
MFCIECKQEQGVWVVCVCGISLCPNCWFWRHDCEEYRTAMGFSKGQKVELANNRTEAERAAIGLRRGEVDEIVRDAILNSQESGTDEGVEGKHPAKQEEKPRPRRNNNAKRRKKH